MNYNGFLSFLLEIKIKNLCFIYKGIDTYVGSISLNY